VGLELILGDLFVGVGTTVSDKAITELIVGKRVLKSRGGEFAAHIGDDGETVFYAKDQLLNLDDGLMWPGEISLDSAYARDFKNEADKILTESTERNKKLLKKRMNKTVRVLYGELLYGVKQNWSRFVHSLLVGEENRYKYNLAWTEEVWMEAILLSVDGKREKSAKAVAYAIKKFTKLKQSDSEKIDSHLFLADLAVRLQKLYELSRMFNEAQHVSSALMNELNSLTFNTDGNLTDAAFAEVVDLLDWQYGPDAREQYIVDLALHMKSIRNAGNEKLKKELQVKMAALVENYGRKFPELGKIYYNLHN